MVFGVLFPLEPLWVSPLQSEPLMIPLNELFGELLTPISDVLDHVPTREAVEHELPCEWFANSSVATDELPNHNHTATCSTNGNHNHTIPNNNNSGGSGEYVDGGDSKNIVLYTHTSYNGNHSHSISIGYTGSHIAHENRQPFCVVNRWKRTV